LIALTTGEPAGIGPEIALRAAAQADRPVTLVGDAALLETTALAIGLGWPLPAVEVEHVPLARPCLPGRLDPRNAAYVIGTLDRAVDGALAGRYRAVVTAPVQKMPAAITRESLAATLDVLHAGLRTRFALPAPRIGVAGLNPHAGESGQLGREEIDVIAPAVAAARSRGIDASGPLPADTLFVPATLARFDAVLAMFHDQGLPVLKHASFGHGVNVTLGLPFVRTSVDHGTALDLAGTGRADAGSMIAALRLAAELTA